MGIQLIGIEQTYRKHCNTAINDRAQAKVVNHGPTELLCHNHSFQAIPPGEHSAAFDAGGRCSPIGCRQLAASLTSKHRNDARSLDRQSGQFFFGNLLAGSRAYQNMRYSRGRLTVHITGLLACRLFWWWGVLMTGGRCTSFGKSQHLALDTHNH